MWEIPEHVGWQIIHAGEHLKGFRRKWAHNMTEKPQGEIASFRNLPRPPITEPQETDNLRI